MDLISLRAGLLAVSAYKKLLRTPVMERVLQLLDALTLRQGEKGLFAYTEVFYALRARGYPGLGAWLGDALRWSEDPYPLAAERGAADEGLEEAARRDVEVLARLAAIPCDAWLELLSDCLEFGGREVLPTLPRWECGAPFTFEGLTQAYRREGAGTFARYRAFVWERGVLIPVPHPDCPTAEELLGYDGQRAEAAANTRALLAGHFVNNVLLYGESGTGKSATVKNLLTLPGTEELRIIQADKEDLAGLPALIRSLGGRRQKFIIFIDDVTFDRDDGAYSVLKTILEGGVERRPDNVAVYATSNRRHLMRQSISERAGDEMDRSETIREKTSLADRFGLRILFQGLNKTEYLALVDLLAHRRGITLDREELHRRAVAWERSHTSVTPRAALQFVLSLSGDGA